MIFIELILITFFQKKLLHIKLILQVLLIIIAVVVLIIIILIEFQKHPQEVIIKKIKNLKMKKKDKVQKNFKENFEICHKGMGVK